LRLRSAYRSTLPSAGLKIQFEEQADVAQLVEQLIRNQQVVSSSLTVGSSLALLNCLIHAANWEWSASLPGATPLSP
jgi:hypothetical protein